MAEKIQGSDTPINPSNLTFEDKVNAILDKRLIDQTGLPAEFRAWLPKFIEIQDIRLPISQVQGAYLTATDAIHLGGDVHGRIGMIRAGSSPYDFIQVTYDSIYGKWVSDPTLWSTMVADSFTTISTSYDTVPQATQGVSVWGPMTTAGLKPQLRFFAVMTVDAGGTASAVCALNSFDSAGALNSPVEDASLTLTTTSATIAVKFTNWVDVPAGVTADDYLINAIELKTSNAAFTASITASNVWLRWVSI